MPWRAETLSGHTQGAYRNGGLRGQGIRENGTNEQISATHAGSNMSQSDLTAPGDSLRPRKRVISIETRLDARNGKPESNALLECGHWTRIGKEELTRKTLRCAQCGAQKASESQ